MTDHSTITLDLTDDVASWLTNIDVTFSIEIETCPREPYSWGQSRGTETTASVKVKSAKVNSLIISRAQLVAMTCEAAVARMEEAAAERAVVEADLEGAA